MPGWEGMLDKRLTRNQLHGTEMTDAEQYIPERRQRERVQQALEWGLPSAMSVRDRTIPLFNRSHRTWSSHGTYLNVPFQEDMRALESPDVAFIGAPLDAGTTFRSGTRFGPQGIRQMSALSSGYNVEMGVDLYESLDMVDVGDVNVIPANIEKSFDQIDKAVAYLHEHAIFPVVLGGDHSVGYPDIRGMAPYIDGNIGIIHFDRHSDISEYNLDERMHGTPFFHATNIPNAPASNLVQIGIGGWLGNRSGVKVSRERQASCITLTDIDRYGLERTCELALELAWKNAKAVFLSFDIDSIDPAFAPGTGTPEAGGLLPREALTMLRLLCREGIAGMEVVEVAPPYDHADITSVLASRIVNDVLGILVTEGKLGRSPREPEPEMPESESADE